MIFEWKNHYAELAVSNSTGWEYFKPNDHLMRFYVEDDHDYEPEPWEIFFNDWLASDEPAQITGIVLDRWWTWNDPVERMSADYVLAQLDKARERLPLLRALFVGHITERKWALSSITQGNYAPVLAAYPQLESLVIRGGTDLSFGLIQHQQLKTLVIQTTGLPAKVVRELAAADLPALEHLELWLGSHEAGGNSTVADLHPILNGERFPALKNLCLRNCDYADALAQALATAPMLERINMLDLSLGNLSDIGAEALFASPAIRKLDLLVLHHHYLSDDMLDCWSSIELAVEASCQQFVGDHAGNRARAIAVSEYLQD
ncbi:STM4015 family protein [Herpetosiphon llansteffanensis]|uniref:STM4015 family protein n=1 Tax=Herpetosiphon llansteffanensis TaxID=2094568 RepID=UPI000D7BF345|nr:STM4015 family protein [Herpetosiphon llansteffanensis]